MIKKLPLFRGSDAGKTVPSSKKDGPAMGLVKKPKDRYFLPSRIKGQLRRQTDASNLANALIASIGEGLIIVDEYGRISHINDQALETLGFERDELEGAWMPGTLQIRDKKGRDLEPTERPSVRAILSGKPVTDIIYYKRKDGELIPVSTTASPFLLKDRPTGAVIIFRDISRELQVEKAKDEFVSLASHQLRTPLTSIRFFAELLQQNNESKLDERQNNYIDKILFSTEKMIDLVTDLLNVSRLDLGQLTIQPEPTSLNALIKLRIAEIEPIANSKSISVKFTSTISDARKIPLDRTLLAQVIHNLLSNALRYTPKGGKISVTVSEKSKNIEIAVKDSGIGIPQADKEKIFHRFYRAHNAAETINEGTGLGLYLVKTIMEGSQCKVRFTSAEKKGTTFFISIPKSGMQAKLPG